MPLLAGAASLTRFSVVSMPSSPTFDDLRFRELVPGSEAREALGFVPFEPDGAYEVANRRLAFRVRIDRVTPDPTAVRERLASLLRVERQEAGGTVAIKKRSQLKELAEEEELARSTPKSKIIECVLEQGVLHVASTANLHLGRVIELLRRVQVIVDFKTPWIDHGEAPAQSEILDSGDPVASAHGARFLAALLDDDEIKFEPVAGYARLQTRHARVTLAGAVLRDVYRYVEEGAELLAAKLLAGTTSFTLDALNFRLGGCSFERRRGAEHWSEVLDERLEDISALWELLDRKYAEHRRAARRRREGRGRSGRDRPANLRVVPREP